MKNKLRNLFITLLPHLPFLRKLLLKLSPSSCLLNRQILQENYLRDYIQNYYDKEALQQKLFYNIGAGYQRSKFPVWSYVDLKAAGYDEKGIDVFYDLESLAPLPLEPGKAEVIFSSFVIEHISANATRNLCSEAFKALKPGGVFHSKIHSFEYGYLLWKNNLLPAYGPFGGRESQAELDAFIKRHGGKIRGFFDRSRGYVLESLKKPGDVLVFSPSDLFLVGNAVTAYLHVRKEGGDSKKLLDSLPGDNMKDFFGTLQREYVDQSTRRPHQHNADYIAQDELFAYIKSLGFSKVYFTQPYQSVSPVLWEDALNPIHEGFLYAIEAVK
jgi:SAM-dependent methyltransferase